MIKKRIGYVLATGFTAGALALGSVAWACTPQNGVTRLTGPTFNDYSYARNEPIQGYAQYVISVGAPGDTNWKLYMGTGGKWCMAGESFLHQLSTAHTYTDVGNPEGYVPFGGPSAPASGVVPTSSPLGSVDICMNNGDGYGNTATPVTVTITRR